MANMRTSYKTTDYACSTAAVGHAYATYDDFKSDFLKGSSFIGRLLSEYHKIHEVEMVADIAAIKQLAKTDIRAAAALRQNQRSRVHAVVLARLAAPPPLEQLPASALMEAD